MGVAQSVGAYLILATTYLGLALGRLPGLRMNRATLALVGSALLIALGVLPLDEAWAAIDANTIVFLLSMMVVNAHLSYAGFFQWAIATLLCLTRSPLGLLVVLTLASGTLSAVFLNDTLALVLTPLTLSLAQTLQLNPIPYLLAIAAATNIGSVATLSGNPQNILVGSFSAIGYVEFATVLTPVAIAGLCIQTALLWLFYPEVRSTQPCLLAPTVGYRVYRPLLIKTGVVAGGLLLAFLLGAPLGESALLAAALLLITRRLKPSRALSQVDWNLLVLFSGLFILTTTTQRLQGLQWLTPLAHHPLGLMGVVTVLSNLISNVPAVLLLSPLIPPDDTQAWLILAAGSTLAGNLTLFGAIANLIVAESAKQQGYPLTFATHLRFGLPVTGLTMAIAYLWITQFS